MCHDGSRAALSFAPGGGSFRGEEVALSAVLVRASRAEKVPAIAVAVRGLLEAAHKRKDWDVQVPSAR